MGIPLDMVDVEIKSYHFGVPAFFLLPGACALLNRATFPLLRGFFIPMRDVHVRIMPTNQHSVIVLRSFK
jgi:hypothetical protein